METSELPSAWEKLQAGDTKARDAIVDHYCYLVEQLASTIFRGLPTLVERDDLVSDGYIGLLDAIDKFDSTRGYQFQTYATTRIRGAILDGLRRLDWVPRNERHAIRQLRTAEADLEVQLQRTPTSGEVQERLSWDEPEFHRVLSRASELTGGFGTLDMPDEATGESVPRPDTPSSDLDIPGASDNMDLLQASLAKSIEHLDEKSRSILGMRYAVNMSFAEIGLVLGVSESRVSQLHTKIIEEVRRSLVSGI